MGSDASCCASRKSIDVADVNAEVQQPASYKSTHDTSDASRNTSNMSATTGNMDAVNFLPCAPLGTAQVSLHGPRLPGGRKFLGGAFTADGQWLIGVPACSRHILRMDVSTGQVSTLPGGEGRIPRGKFKWLRGIRARDGAVFCIPACGDGVLRISATGEVSILGVGALPKGEWMWHGGALAHDDCIYCIPANAPRVLKIDTVQCSVSLIGPDLHLGVKNKWYGGIKAHDGSIWGKLSPSRTEQILPLPPLPLPCVDADAHTGARPCPRHALQRARRAQDRAVDRWGPRARHLGLSPNPDPSPTPDPIPR